MAIYVSEKELRQYNRYRPIHIKFKTVRGFGFSHQEFFVATKNSPLTSILRHGSLILQENGVLAALDAKWVGKELELDSSRTTEAFVLETKQLMLSFVILSGAMVVSLVVLICERMNLFR